MSDFLRRNRSEAIKMSIFECDEEKIICAIREDEFEQGIEKGRLEGETLGKTISIKNLMGKYELVS